MRVLLWALCLMIGACAPGCEPNESAAGSGYQKPPTRGELSSNLKEISDSFRLLSDVSGCPIVAEAERSSAFSAAFTLQNRSHEPWQIMEIYLPWRNAIRLLALGHNGKALKVEYPKPDGRHFREVVVEPGASISGTLDLRQKLPGLETALRESPVSVLWVFRPAGLASNCAPSGVLELGRN